MLPLIIIPMIIFLCLVMLQGPIAAPTAPPGDVPQIQMFAIQRGRVVAKRKDATNNAIVANQTHNTLTLTAETNHVYEIMDIGVIPDLVPDGQLAPTSNLDTMDLTIEDYLAIRGKVNNIGKNSFPFPTVTSIQKPLLQRMREIAMNRMLTHPPDPNGVRDGKNLLQCARFWVDEGQTATLTFKASAIAVANAYFAMIRYREYIQTGLEKRARFMPGGEASSMRFFYSLGRNKTIGTVSSTVNKVDESISPKGTPFPFEQPCEDNKWYEIWAMIVAPDVNQEETSISIAGETVGADVNVGFLTNPQINECPFGDDDDRMMIKEFDEPIIVVEGQNFKTFFENDGTLACAINDILVGFIGVEHLISL